MNKAFVSAILMGLLTATGFVAYAQKQEQAQSRQQQQQQQQPAQGQSSVDEVFDRLDTDHDGKLTEAEFTRAHAGSSAQEVKARFAEIDANGDKSISKQEFTAKYGSQGE